MSVEQNKMTIEIADREVIMTRVVNAPRELVFEVWTNAEHLSRWFAPQGFETTAETDPRPGGAFRIVMHATEALPPEFAGDYPMKGIYQEFVPPERIVFTSDLSEHSEKWKEQLFEHCGTRGDDALLSVATVTFDDLGGKTKITVRSRFASNAIRDGYVKTGMNEGWEQTFDRLASLVNDLARQ